MTERERIFRDVVKAMQSAEEIGGPEGPEYPLLMSDIAIEATTRIRVFWNTQRDRQQKKTPLSFEDFRKSGRNVRFQDIPDLAPMELTTYGRAYDGNIYLQLMDDGKWLLSIYNDDYADHDLYELERRLYKDFYIPEFKSL